MSDYFKRVNALTPTRFWVNNVTPEQAKEGIAAGAVGCTQNPAYLDKMFAARPDYCRDVARKHIALHDSDTEVLIRMQAELVGEIAKEFAPLHAATMGEHGHVTIQGDPFDEHTPAILRQAKIAAEYGANVMPKIPAVTAAFEAMGQLASEGVALCCTEVFAVRQAIDVGETIVKATKGKAVPVIQLAHIAGIYDECLGNYVKANKVDISPDVLWHAGIAVAKKVYAIITERRYPVKFLGGGARGLHHFTEMVGINGTVTINYKGTTEDLLKENPVVVQRFHMPTPASVIDELTEKLPDFRKGYYIDAIEPKEYEGFGPVALFRSTFEKSWKIALEKVAALRAGK